MIDTPDSSPPTEPGSRVVRAVDIAVVWIWVGLFGGGAFGVLQGVGVLPLWPVYGCPVGVFVMLVCFLPSMASVIWIMYRGADTVFGAETLERLHRWRRPAFFVGLGLIWIRSFLFRG